MKNKNKPKPRVMWAWPSHLAARAGPIWASRKRMLTNSAQIPIRVAVIPLDDVEAIVKRADKAYWTDYRQSMAGDLTQIRAALTAAGIPCKRKASK